MKILLSITLFFNLSSASASMRDLVQEYLSTNSEILKSKAKIESSILNISSVEAQNIWSLTYSGQQEKNNLEQLTIFSVKDTTTTSHMLSLKKDFNWGGAFSLNNTLLSYDSPRSTSTTNGFSQGVSYVQDLGVNFLGRSYYSEHDTAENTHASTKALNNHLLQVSLFTFANNYSQAKLNISLLELQIDAQRRAKQRKELIKRRVKDGLKEKVDLIQANIELLASNEEVQAARIQRQASLEILSNSLHRNVKQVEIDSFNYKKLNMKNIPAGDDTGNFEIRTLNFKVDALKSSKNQIDYSFWPTLNVGFEYNVNEYDDQKSTAISDGGLLGHRASEETKISVNLMWTMGNESQDVARAKNNIELRTAEMENDKLKINFLKSEESLIKQVKFLEKNLVSVKSRKSLAKKALKEVTKLYNRGRVDFNRVIMAEETLINTEKSLIRYLAQRENFIYKLASLYGTLEEYLIK